MKKFALVALSATALLLGYVASTTARTQKDPCTITCYEKTPTCYVTKDSNGCLEISNVKPAAKKGSSICTLKGCESKTVYDPMSGEKPVTTTQPNRNE